MGKDSPSNKNDGIAFSYRSLHKAAHVSGKPLRFRDWRVLQDFNLQEYILEKGAINFVSSVTSRKKDESLKKRHSSF